MHKSILTLGVAAIMALSTNVNANQVDPVKQEQGMEILQALFDTAYGEGNVNVRTGEFDREAMDKFDKEHNFRSPDGYRPARDGNHVKPQHENKPMKPQHQQNDNHKPMQNHKPANNQHHEAH